MIGYIQGDGLLPTNLVNNARVATAATNTAQAMAPANVPATATAVIGNWDTWIGVNDHFNNFLGRNVSMVDAYLWDNR